MKVPEKVLERFTDVAEERSGQHINLDLWERALEAALEQLREELEDGQALAHAPKRLEEMAHFYEGDGLSASRAVMAIAITAVLGESND